MTTTLNSAQISYLQNVLGLRSILLPSDVSPSRISEGAALRVQTRGSIAKARLVALWGRERSTLAQTLAQTLAETENLVAKMVLAMKIPPDEVFWIQWDEGPGSLPENFIDEIQNAGSRPLPILVFGEKTAERFIPVKVQTGSWLEYRGSRYLVTLSPESLVSSQERKRLAWAHLQMVMKEIS